MLIPLGNFKALAESLDLDLERLSSKNFNRQIERSRLCIKLIKISHSGQSIGSDLEFTIKANSYNQKIKFKHNKSQGFKDYDLTVFDFLFPEGELDARIGLAVDILEKEKQLF